MCLSYRSATLDSTASFMPFKSKSTDNGKHRNRFLQQQILRNKILVFHSFKTKFTSPWTMQVNLKWIICMNCKNQLIPTHPPKANPISTSTANCVRDCVKGNYELDAPFVALALSLS